MHQALERACRKLDLQIDALAEAARFSDEQVTEARQHFSERLEPVDELDIVVCGSMARGEMSLASDFDYLVVAHGLVQEATLLQSFRTQCDRWCTTRNIHPPGSTAVFGQVVSAPELVERIGLEFDTNASLTRRILLLEEGVSVLRPDLHRNFVNVILGRYLLDDGRRGRPPGFLLNDVVRYWRTIAVDYEAKIWRDATPDGWGLRFLKLRISRKLTFVSAVVSAFLAAMSEPQDPRGFLVEQFVDFPALARIAQLVDYLDEDEGAMESLRCILDVADEFCAFLHDPDARKAAKAVVPPADAADSEPFRRMNARAKELQAALERLFFDTALSSLSRRYLPF